MSKIAPKTAPVPNRPRKSEPCSTNVVTTIVTNAILELCLATGCRCNASPGKNESRRCPIKSGNNIVRIRGIAIPMAFTETPFITNGTARGI